MFNIRCFEFKCLPFEHDEIKWIITEAASNSFQNCKQCLSNYYDWRQGLSNKKKVSHILFHISNFTMFNGICSMFQFAFKGKSRATITGQRNWINFFVLHILLIAKKNIDLYISSMLSILDNFYFYFFISQWVGWKLEWTKRTKCIACW